MNLYDDDVFFQKYQHMFRSQYGLEGAGEWPTLKSMLPNLSNISMLDLGCGYGWHCDYAMKQGAKMIVGVDISQKMLQQAKKLHSHPNITYIHHDIQNYDMPFETYDLVLSSLVFHYLPDFSKMAQRIYQTLKPGGTFIFSVEHPIFTSEGSQDWYYDQQGHILHFPVDHYFDEGQRNPLFLGEPTTKYHRTLTTYVQNLRTAKFIIEDIQEPMPPQSLMHLKGMSDEMRRPMMIIFSAKKPF